jgi:hypothetical protein
MAELKTKATNLSVDDFLGKATTGKRQKDCKVIIQMMETITKSGPKMWGSAIIGFGSRVLKYPNGRELDWFVTGFSPRKQNLTLYLSGIFEREEKLMKKLGKYKTGKGCLYINDLDEVDLSVLKELISAAVKSSKK